MPSPENKLIPDSSTAETALLVRSETEERTADEQTAVGPAGEGLDLRLERLRMQLDVMVRLRSLRVGDLLALAGGAVLETVHEHSQDLPVRCGGALLMWAEFARGAFMEEALKTRMPVGLPLWVARTAEWVRRLGTAPATAALLHLESRVSLGPKKSLVLVNCCGRRVLLAIAGDAITPVMEVASRRRRDAAKEREG